MSYEKEFERKLALRKKEEAEKAKIEGIELAKDIINEIDGFLTKLKQKEHIGELEKIEIYKKMKGPVYAADKETWVFWKENLLNFKDKKAGQDIINVLELYLTPKAA